MREIAIIGAGQIGSRHLQALALLGESCRLHIVDPSPSSLEVAASRFKETAPAGTPVTPYYHNSLSELPRQLDLAIVATNADVRRRVVEELAEHGELRYLILEKVLFQRPGDYDSVGDLLETHGVKAWVNCPRREWPAYRALKEKLAGRDLFEVHVSGSNWGLGCNSIHMLDLISFLSARSEYTLSTASLDPFLSVSRRAGFVEFTGALTGSFSSGPFFSISSYARGSLPDIIEVCGDGFRWIIREPDRKLLATSEADGWSWSEEAFDVPYQSRLTNVAAESILATGECHLPTYTESALLHKPLLEGLLGHMKRIAPEKAEDLCPIT